jgi:glucokinase
MSDKVAIGLDVGGTGTKGALVSTAGDVLERSELRTDVTAGTKGIIAVAEDLMERARGLGLEVGGVGAGVAGFVDAADGSVTFSPNLTYDDPAIAAAVKTRIDLPVVVDNDANAAAWGEYRFGSARGLDHLAMLTLGTGVGGGFVVDGRLLRGSRGAGAEFGHMVVVTEGELCNCGLRGCLEQYASGQAIARMGREALEKDPTSAILSFAGSQDDVRATHIAQAARNYDSTATEVLRRAGKYLGIGMSNLVNVFDPLVIVLGGSVVRAGEPYLGPARDTLTEMLTAQKRRAVRLDVSTLGNDAGIVGAAALAMDPIASWEGRHYE